MEKINLVEILKSCPHGMELYCTSYDNVSFDKISDDKKATYPIFCYITDENGNRSSISFTENGCESKRYGAKCVIFPKGKTTWEGFVSPCKFKDEDVVSTTTSIKLNKFIPTYCVIKFSNKEEKQELFNAIKAAGYKWNAETMTLEKLIIPKFKVGDRIKHKIINFTHVITGIKDEYYIMDEVSFPHGILPIEVQNEYELVPDKFDFTTLKPFDKVLVRGNNHKWKIQFFEKFDKELKYPFICMDGRYSLCIPYNGNEHLHDTTTPCSDYYQI